MNLYQRKPVVIEAKQLTANNISEIEAWCGGSIKGVRLPAHLQCIDIQTPTGERRAEIGDFIVKAGEGVFYPYDAQCFHLSYAPVDDTPTIDLDAILWESIQEAARQSPWIPPQYYANDWVSDVCAFLTDPREAPAHRIVCAAIRHLSGNIVCGVRHYDANMRGLLENLPFSGFGAQVQQGFVDNFGVFHTRYEAWPIAEAAGQIIRRVGGDSEGGGKLFSENLY